MKKQVLVFIIAVWFSSVLTAGAYEFSPGASLSLSEEYDDNILLSKTNRESDFVTSVIPRVNLALRSADSELRADYSPIFSYYNSHDELNTVSQVAGAHGRLQVSDKVSFAADDILVISKELRELIIVSDLGPVRRRAERLVNSLSGSLSYKPGGHFSYTLGGSYIDTSNKESDLSDVNSYSGDAGIAYTLSERSTISANARFTEYDYSAGNDADSQEYVLGITHRLTPTLTMSATGGAVLVNIERDVKRDVYFSGGLDLTKRFAQGSATFAYRQAVVPGLEEQSPLKSQVISFRFEKPLTPRWALSISPAYSMFRSIGNSGSDSDVISISSELTYNIRRWAGITFSYNYANYRYKNNSASDYYDNRIGVALRLYYEKGRNTNNEWEPPKP